MKPKVVVVCGDPGGAAAVLPVVKWLKKDGIVEVTGSLGRLPEDAKLLLTGTSGEDGYFEKLARVRARRKGIPSVSVLDFWSNYRMRFSEYGGEMNWLPDRIAIMDEFARDEMIVEGFPPDRLVITGQPAFDCLADKREKFKPHHKYWTKRGHGVHPDRKLVVFASQPLSKCSFDYGYTEHTVIPMLIDALAEIGEPVHLIIRPHPREKVSDLLMYESAGNPYVTIKRKGDKHHLLMSADLVAGMNTELLVESCYLGCITLSLQPGMKGTDRLPTNRLGVSTRCTEQTIGGVTLLHLLFDNFLREILEDAMQDFRITEPAAPKVAQLVYEMIGVNDDFDTRNNGGCFG